jgi:hypothetical protein
VRSDVLRRTVPAHLHTNSYLHSISIGRAFAARPASSKSLYRKRARAPSSCYPLQRKRASDKALRLIRTLKASQVCTPTSSLSCGSYACKLFTSSDEAILQTGVQCGC